MRICNFLAGEPQSCLIITSPTRMQCYNAQFARFSPTFRRPCSNYCMAVVLLSNSARSVGCCSVRNGCQGRRSCRKSQLYAAVLSRYDNQKPATQHVASCFRLCGQWANDADSNGLARTVLSKRSVLWATTIYVEVIHSINNQPDWLKVMGHISFIFLFRLLPRDAYA